MNPLGQIPSHGYRETRAFIPGESRLVRTKSSPRRGQGRGQATPPRRRLRPRPTRGARKPRRCRPVTEEAPPVPPGAATGLQGRHPTPPSPHPFPPARATGGGPDPSPFPSTPELAVTHNRVPPRTREPRPLWPQKARGLQREAGHGQAGRAKSGRGGRARAGKARSRTRARGLGGEPDGRDTERGTAGSEQMPNGWRENHPGRAAGGGGRRAPRVSPGSEAPGGGGRAEPPWKAPPGGSPRCASLDALSQYNEPVWGCGLKAMLSAPGSQVSCRRNCESIVDTVTPCVLQKRFVTGLRPSAPRNVHDVSTAERFLQFHHGLLPGAEEEGSGHKSGRVAPEVPQKSQPKEPLVSCRSACTWPEEPAGKGCRYHHQAENNAEELLIPS
ncbi:LOW QUALITY PROTEIN: translation initiation factor IF-2-like [Mustela erminea]|uniref:LOW QUALITY PROTEIN: translation initiation factor IF-2-like n=1 Tax=Mustela erminea TaxID=36723 RepID=UPI001386BF44|nr:LOW QUALITY PROTEIN: translation initiation factor IF-2-like [Mustela erminea]